MKITMRLDVDQIATFLSVAKEQQMKLADGDINYDSYEGLGAYEFSSNGILEVSASCLTGPGQMIIDLITATRNALDEGGLL